jgi:hypothetical protein
MRKVIIILSTIILVTACKKDAENGNCVLLKEGMKANNVQQVGTVITKYISSLQTNEYTEENINKLMLAIKGQCNLNAGIYCFDCISTLPSQTEIWIEFNNAGTTMRKTIDLTYTYGTTKMKFGNMHD